ncbi:MAG: Gfo/Idh/MocA family oxidoreductase [Nanoarchaeota archaeon]|nr:Gfo/Idh/MocA family oxidoreductase [Nanoarchaeota archaeon]
MYRKKVAVLGVGSIGEFHAREFNNSGCDVVAILTSSKESSIEKANKLKELYGINAVPYWDIDDLLKNNNLDMISICTPSKSHSEYIKKCLNKNLNILCEKPFIYDSLDKNYKIAKELILSAEKDNKVLSVNTQLVSILEQIPKNYLTGIKEFSMYMEPSIEGAINLVIEAIPHMNSFIIKLMGNQRIENLKFPLVKNDEVIIRFKYGRCNAEYHFSLKRERPRKVKFKINGVEFERKIGENYSQTVEYDKNSIEIKDPLKVSIQQFIGACNLSGEPLVTKSELLYNLKIQDFIIHKLSKVIQR